VTVGTVDPGSQHVGNGSASGYTCNNMQSLKVATGVQSLQPNSGRIMHQRRDSSTGRTRLLLCICLDAAVINRHWGKRLQGSRTECH